MTDCTLYIFLNLRQENDLDKKIRNLQKSFYEDEEARTNMAKRSGPLGFFHKNHITIITIKIGRKYYSSFKNIINTDKFKSFLIKEINNILSKEIIRDYNTFKLFGNKKNWFLVNEFALDHSTTKITDFRSSFYNYIDTSFRDSYKEVYESSTITKQWDRDGNRETLINGDLIYKIPDFLYGKNKWSPHISIVNGGTINHSIKRHKLSYNGDIYKQYFDSLNYKMKPTVDLSKFNFESVGTFNLLDKTDKVTVSIICGNDPEKNLEKKFSLDRKISDPMKKIEVLPKNTYNPNKIYKLLEKGKYIDIGNSEYLIKKYGSRNIKFINYLKKVNILI